MALVALALLLAALSWLARPQQVAALVLHRAGAALGLEVSFDGAAEYRLRGTPHLMVRGLQVRQPGAGQTLLSARRAYLALPWSTLRGAGGELTVERIELDAPVLDLAALQAWLAGRTSNGAPRIPTLTGGLRVTGGTVAGAGWTLRRLGLDVPTLYPGRRTTGRASGELLAGHTRLPFDLQVMLSAPAPDAAIGIAGIATVVDRSWHLPMRPVLSARLHAGADGLGLDGMRLGMRARHVAPGSQPVEFTAGLAAPLRYLDGRLALADLALVVRGDGTVPDLGGRGSFAWDAGMELDLGGTIERWPAAWPPLPEPLGSSVSPLPFALAYAGPADLSGPASLRLKRDRARLESAFHLPDVLDWLERLPAGTPLPPLHGRLVVPRVEIAGAILHGVEIEMSAEAAEP
ncbi:hypothetical protein LY625_03375 [Lysobacter sp. GX 14042]|uniref:hypothetical protein n=1 Tax=Lysobacter sp. GX 14042 TaxID=2907155 RepID=UPI001F330FB3|nr:hypothetical protein [Lysobacter sp. GX 14042]MCE7031668.1 hypothetical protein [Lysobacter sp. GX 14042]